MQQLSDRGIYNVRCDATTRHAAALQTMGQSGEATASRDRTCGGMTAAQHCFDNRICEVRLLSFALLAALWFALHCIVALCFECIALLALLWFALLCLA